MDGKNPAAISILTTTTPSKRSKRGSALDIGNAVTPVLKYP
jgi:hypothetical protein